MRECLTRPHHYQQNLADAMDNVIYNALCHYYRALERLGYYSYGDVYKLLVLVFLRDFVYQDYRGILSMADYRTIEKALSCLYGTSCLTPYPDYLKMGKLYLGQMTELSQRIKQLEDTEVVKPLPEDIVDSESEIEIYEETEEE